MVLNLEIAAGSTMGRDHRERGRNNQDAWVTLQNDDLVIAIVADGCGSGACSELGSRVGARVLATLLEAQFVSGRPFNWPMAERQLLARLDALAVSMGGPYRRIVEDHFLFTLVGVVTTTQTTTLFAMGDGIIALNGQVHHLGPFADNMPPYIGYSLLDGRTGIDSDALHLVPWRELTTSEVDSWLIGTDGVDDLIARQGLPLPGLTDVVLPLSELWESDRYFSGNPDLLSRRLRLMARDWPRQNPQPGYLSDDTTIIVGRRTKGG